MHLHNIWLCGPCKAGQLFLVQSQLGDKYRLQLQEIFFFFELRELRLSQAPASGLRSARATVACRAAQVCGARAARRRIGRRRCGCVVVMLVRGSVVRDGRGVFGKLNALKKVGNSGLLEIIRVDKCE